MLLRKGCLALGGIGFLLISGCLWLLSSVGEAEHIAEAPVEYCTLSPSEQEMIPPFAKKIYSAVYADWQIGEWCYCFEIQRGNEKALKNWCKEVCAGRDAIQPSVRPYHLTTPSWWEIPSGASLLCAVAGDLQHPMSFSAWYDAAQNKVWLMYHR